MPKIIFTNTSGVPDTYSPNPAGSINYSATNGNGTTNIGGGAGRAGGSRVFIVKYLRSAVGG